MKNKKLTTNVVSIEKLNQFKEKIISDFIKMLKENGHIEPMIFFSVLESDEIEQLALPIIDFLQSTDAKNQLVEVIEKILTEHNVLSMLTITEGFSSSTKDVKDLSNFKPSQQPDKKEILLIGYETTFTNETTVYDIIRGDDSIVISDKPLIANNSIGRFSNLLSKQISTN